MLQYKILSASFCKARNTVHIKQFTIPIPRILEKQISINDNQNSFLFSASHLHSDIWNHSGYSFSFKVALLCSFPDECFYLWATVMYFCVFRFKIINISQGSPTILKMAFQLIYDQPCFLVQAPTALVEVVIFLMCCNTLPRTPNI